MQINRVAVTRKFNTGNYSNVTFHAEASVESEDKAIQCIGELDDMLIKFYELKKTEQQIRQNHQQRNQK
jgi:hypothetical protein